VYFVDAANNNMIGQWYYSSGAWAHTFLSGDTALAGTSPAALLWNGTPQVYFVDATQNNLLGEWYYSSGWFLHAPL
jgi:hypothetical protein